jgi:hypothetical protein
MSKLDKLGSECMQLHSKIVAGARRIASDRKDYNERRKAITAELREKLTPVWAALKAGKSVNGQTTIEGWCRLANPSAKYPERQFQKIMSPKGEHSSPRPSPKRTGILRYTQTGCDAYRLHTLDFLAHAISQLYKECRDHVWRSNRGCPHISQPMVVLWVEPARFHPTYGRTNERMVLIENVFRRFFRHRIG